MLQVNIDLYNSNPLTVVGMYCPHQLPARQHLYSTYTANKLDRTTVVAGDFNATLQDEDRASGLRYRPDDVHREFMTQHDLLPVSCPSLAPMGVPRQYTYRKGCSETLWSRIDDVLINQPAIINTDVHTIDMIGRFSDHDPLVASVPFSQLNLMPPLPELISKQAEPPLERLTEATKTVLRMQLLETHGEQCDALAIYTDEIVSRCVRPHWDMLEHHHTADRPMPLQTIGRDTARQVVDDLGTSMSHLLEQCRGTMMEVCPTRPTNIHGLHYRPGRSHGKCRNQSD
jgi:hypothetical protein